MFRVVLVLTLVPILWALAIPTDASNISTSTDKSPIKLNATITNTVVPTSVLQKGQNATETPQNKKTAHFETDSSMIQRALYVLIGITIIGVLYFLVRAVR